MQGSAATVAAIQAAKPRPFPEEQEQNLRCPRCDSTNTKFCYYNNYNLSQPRHFCKNCRRYWTKGGALRNIPVGGGTRKNSKRSSSSSYSSISKRSNPPKPPSHVTEPPKTEATVSVLCSPPPPPLDPGHHMLNMTGSFSSLLACDGHLETFLGSLPPIAPIGATLFPNSSGVEGMELQSFTGNDGMDTFERLEGESGCWAAGWTDLAIFNPGSTFQ